MVDRSENGKQQKNVGGVDGEEIEARFFSAESLAYSVLAKSSFLIMSGVTPGTA